jgi:hypothetical protein
MENPNIKSISPLDLWFSGKIPKAPKLRWWWWHLLAADHHFEPALTLESTKHHANHREEF